MLRDERRSESQLERLPRPVVLPAPTGASPQQRRRMLLALGFLLVALVAVLLKDWDFWFPPRPEAQDAAYTPSNAKNPAATEKTSARANHARRATRPAETAPATDQLPAVKAERTALPPMSMEVISGSRRSVLSGRNSAINVDLSKESAPPAPTPAPASAVVSAADRVQLSQQATQTVTKSVAPDYPLLARQMKVQGAVVLQALISREGSIQELQVLSGPSILADAAREAVRQWRFKPYFLNGEAIETQAKITVNFTISTN